MINNGQSIQEFYEQQGYVCSFCTEIYDVRIRAKQPTMLSCEQHNLCIGCVEEYGERLRDCPECRAPLKMKKPLLPNSQAIGAMDVIKKLWDKMQHSQAPAAAASLIPTAAPSAPVIAVEPPQMLIPANFACHSLCLDKEVYQNVGTKIVGALPTVVKVMGWQNEAHELQTTFEKNASEWLSLTNLDNKEIAAIAQLKSINLQQWEVH
jgi:hypothetical protein